MDRPLVSIGLPVFNGERFLRDALDCLLRQTFARFELIISDNASTDATAEICRDYAAKDGRIRYGRSSHNRGASWNFNHVFDQASGQYFMWAAHDDAHAPDYVRRCVEVLDSDPRVVLCYTQEMGIDDAGNQTGLRPYLLDTSLKRPQDRFGALMALNRGSPPIFGLMRAEVLRRTPRIGPYVASDLVLLAELALQGKLHEIPEPLLLHREHNQRSVYANPSWHKATLWHDTSKRGKIIFPHWRVLAEYFSSIGRSPLSAAVKLSCCKHVLRWGRYNWRPLLQDLGIAARQLVGKRAGAGAAASPPPAHHPASARPISAALSGPSGFPEAESERH